MLLLNRTKHWIWLIRWMTIWFSLRMLLHVHVISLAKSKVLTQKGQLTYTQRWEILKLNQLKGVSLHSPHQRWNVRQAFRCVKSHRQQEVSVSRKLTMLSKECSTAVLLQGSMVYIEWECKQWGEQILVFWRSSYSAHTQFFAWHWSWCAMSVHKTTGVVLVKKQLIATATYG
jgi:hypothetical protein